MAIVREKVTFGDIANGTDLTISVSLGSTTTGRLLVAVLHRDDAGNDGYATGLDVAGAAMTEVTAAREERVVVGALRSQIFYKEETTSTGATNFVITLPATDSGDTHGLTVYEFTGANNASPIGAVATNPAAGTDQTYTLTTTAADSYIVCGLVGVDAPGAPATGITEDVDNAPESPILFWAGSRSTTSATGYTVGATVSVYFGLEQAAGSAVEIKEPVAGDALTAQAITAGTPEMSAATIGQTHALMASNIISGQPLMTAAGLAGFNYLTAQDIVTGTPEIDAPTLADLPPDTLTALEITMGRPEISEPAIGQEHVLAVDDIITGKPEITVPIIDPLGRHNQEERQRSVRLSTSGALHYNGDWHQLFDDASIPAGGMNERMIQWVNIRLGTSYTNINGALVAWANSEGVNRFDEISLFDA